MTRGWFRRSRKVTADTARRITGISIPFGGLQWADPGPSDREHVRRFIVFLEDRRVLYNPEILEVTSEVHRSVNDIRHQCTAALQQFNPAAFATLPIKTIRSACRRFHDDETLEFRLVGGWRQEAGRDAGFFTALGGFRPVVGQQVALLAAHYDLDVEGDLAAVLPQIDDE